MGWCKSFMNEHEKGDVGIVISFDESMSEEERKIALDKICRYIEDCLAGKDKVKEELDKMMYKLP